MNSSTNRPAHRRSLISRIWTGRTTYWIGLIQPDNTVHYTQKPPSHRA